jgi:hypothetical protein
MNRTVMSLVFGAVVAQTVNMISPFTIANWQWWVAVLAIGITGMAYSETKK